MADTEDDDRDEEWFKEVYGSGYTGPSKAPHENPRDTTAVSKASSKRVSANISDSDEDNEPRDPYAVPTDFTSREAKVWEAKAKAVERNWKRRKEEELTCRLCGEVGHFAQGCPTTLGGNRKSGEVVERIPLRDKRLKPRIIGTGGSIIQGIEKDTGCRLKLEDNLTAGNGAFFVKVTGPDRMTVSKAVDAVSKLVEQVEDEWKQQQGVRRPSGGGGFRGGPTVNPLIAAQMQHIASQRLHHNNSNTGGPGRGEPMDEEKRTIEHIASQLEARRQWEAVSGSSQQSLNGSYKEGHPASGAGSISTPFKGTGPADGGSAFYPDTGGSYPVQMKEELDTDLSYEEQTLDDIERRFLQETIELTKDQNKEEDAENARHRKRLFEIQEHYQQKMTQLRAKQAKQREDFMCHEAHLRYQQPPSSYPPYQYTGAGGAEAFPSVPTFNGSSTYDQDSMENLQANSTVYETYHDGGYTSGGGGGAYNRKQGYDTSSPYSKSETYDTPAYSYGGSQTYPTYG